MRSPIAHSRPAPPGPGARRFLPHHPALEPPPVTWSVHHTPAAPLTLLLLLLLPRGKPRHARGTPRSPPVLPAALAASLPPHPHLRSPPLIHPAPSAVTPLLRSLLLTRPTRTRPPRLPPPRTTSTAPAGRTLPLLNPPPLPPPTHPPLPAPAEPPAPLLSYYPAGKPPPATKQQGEYHHFSLLNPPPTPRRSQVYTLHSRLTTAANPPPAYLRSFSHPPPARFNTTNPRHPPLCTRLRVPSLLTRG